MLLVLGDCITNELSVFINYGVVQSNYQQMGRHDDVVEIILSILLFLTKLISCQANLCWNIKSIG